MGAGNFNADNYKRRMFGHVPTSADRAIVVAERFSSNMFMPERMDPKTIRLRESRLSQEHPKPTSILIGLDQTGSMGQVPKYLVAHGLVDLFSKLQTKKDISDPQICFAAIGDSRNQEAAPLQVGQFESDERCGSDLSSLFLEAKGGANRGESYHLAWFFAMQKCELDSWKQGRKGILITVGDEVCHPRLSETEIKQYIDPDYNGRDLTNPQILTRLQERWEVCHVLVKTETSAEQHAESIWKQELGEENVAVVYNAENVSGAIVRLVESANKRLRMSPLEPEVPGLTITSDFHKTDFDPVKKGPDSVEKETDPACLSPVPPINPAYREESVAASSMPPREPPKNPSYDPYAGAGFAGYHQPVPVVAGAPVFGVPLAQQGAGLAYRAPQWPPHEGYDDYDAGAGIEPYGTYGGHNSVRTSRNSNSCTASCVKLVLVLVAAGAIASLTGFLFSLGADVWADQTLSLDPFDFKGLGADDSWKAYKLGTEIGTGLFTAYRLLKNDKQSKQSNNRTENIYNSRRYG